MNQNLKCPWDESCSPPHVPQIAFFASEAEDFLFDSARPPRILCQAGLRSVGLQWTLHRSTLTTPFQRGNARAEPGNRFVVDLPDFKAPPGFYDLHVTLDTGMAEPHKGVCCFGWNVHEMDIGDHRPADFESFWEKGLEAAKAVPLDYKQESKIRTYDTAAINEYNMQSAALPPNYDPEGCREQDVESWKISFTGPDGQRVYAWLAKPVGTGPFPSLLILPGAGCNPRPRPLEHARHGYLAIDCQIHGQDVEGEPSEYKNLYPAPDAAKPGLPPEDHYFHRLYLRAMRAVDALLESPGADATRVAVAGGSQGGRLAFGVAAFRPEVRALVSSILHGACRPHTEWSEACNATGEHGLDLPHPAASGRSVSRPAELYMDPASFAPHIKCPALLNAGMVDPISPPAGIQAAFHHLPGPDKQLVMMPGIGHDWSAEFDRRAWAWLEEKLS